MSFLIIGILSLLILALFFLAHSRNSSNKFHLDYLLLHLIALTASSALNILAPFFEFVQNPITLLGGLHIVAMMLLILHIESAIIGFKKSIQPMHWLPLLTYLLVSLLNSRGYHLFETNNSSNVFILYRVEAVGPYGDKLLVRLLTSLMLITYVVSRLKTKVNASTTLKNKPLYKIWLYAYTATIPASLTLLSLAYFCLTCDFTQPVLLILSKGMIGILVVSFAINPSIIYYLPSIGKSVNIYNPARENLEFYTIEALMREKQLFLNPRLNLTLICSLTGLKPAVISKAIKTNTSDHFSGYINKYRIEYALSEIASGYLKTYSVVSLGSKSGFASHQTFFRAFRKETGQSPSQYYKAFASKQ